MRKRLLLLGAVLSLLFGKVLAQKRTDWADSVFNTLFLDKSRDFKGIARYGDTLLALYAGRQDYCKWIQTQLYRNNFFAQRGRQKEALHILFLCLSKIQQLPCRESELLSEIYLAYASLYLDLGETARTNYYLKKGIECWQPEWRNKTILIRLYGIKGHLCSNLNEELYYYRLGYKIALETGDQRMQENSLNNIGTAYAYCGLNKQATIYLNQALKFALKRNAYSALSALYNNLAGLTDNRQTIASYVDSANYFARLSGNLEDRHISMMNKAYFYYTIGKYKQGYDTLYESEVLKDSLFNQNKINAFAEMEQKYESEKKSTEIALLKSENEIANLQSSRRLAISLGLGGASIGILFIAIAFYSQNKKKQKLNRALTAEKKKSDDLLLNILPHEVAEELKAKGSADAQLMDQVTVLFTDFIGFTQLSEKFSPQELVAEINHCFSAFDLIMQKYGIEKIKTIGDSYMAAGGLPVPNATHALDVVNAALDIEQFMSNYKAEKQAAGSLFFEIRIGIHTGPVVAGIVGVKKFAYDIWGDTVNTASRIESSGEAGKVNISATTYELVKDDFSCEYRGKVTAKGKGAIDMFFVNRSFSEG